MNPLQLSSFLIALTLLRTAAVAQAAGFRFIEAPAGPDCPVPRGSDVVTLLRSAWRDRSRHRHRAGVKGCPIGGDKLPLIVMSHGRGGSFVGHHDIEETLADAGFVAAAINHPGDTASDMTRSAASLGGRPQPSCRG